MMWAARALWFRWWPAIYAGLFAFEGGFCWGAHSLLFLRLGVTILSFTGATWFLSWRYADRARKAAEKQQRAEAEAQARRQLMRAVDWLN